MMRQQVQPPMRRQAAWVVGWRIVGIVATLAANIVAARLLGPAGFGIYVLVTTVIAVGGIVGMAGLNEAGLRFISERLAHHDRPAARAYLRRVLLVLAVTSLAAACAVGALIWIYFLATAQSPPTWIILIASLGVVVLAFQQVAAELLRGYADLHSASLFSGGQTGGPLSNILLLVALGAVALVAGQLSAPAALTLTVASIFTTAPLAAWMVLRTSRLQATTEQDGSASARLSPLESRTLLTVGGVLMLNQLLAFAGQQLDIWLGGAFLQPADLGLYGAAKRSLLLAAMPIQMAAMTVLPSLPRLYSQGRTRDLERLLRSAASFAAIPALLALCALALFPATILNAAFGGQFSGAAPTVIVLCAGYVVLVLTGSPPAVMVMTGYHHTVLVVNLLAALVLLVVGTLGAIWYGPIGLAAGSAASMAFQNGVLWWLARRRLGVWTHVGKLQTGTARPSEHPFTEAECTNSKLALNNR